ncbi:divergent polysaccharide deacetylase family protein [Antarctobacter sp.]|uniref:divergent polysaccharide deacetylase family protein n=1 Tax=Antarctobacter sp. TaxID=1872577 RepID=UPI003A8FC5E4
MARGILSGAIWGAVFSGAGLAAISLNTPLPEQRAMVPPPAGQVDGSLLVETPDPGPDPRPDIKPDQTPVMPVSEPKPDPQPAAPVPDAPDPSKPRIVETPEADPTAKPDVSKPGVRPQPEAGVDRPLAPTGTLPAPADPVIAGADTAPPEPPQVGPAPDAPDGAGPDVSDAPRLAGQDAPVLPPAQATAPGAPRPEAQPVIVTGPAQPPAPVVPDVDSALIPESLDPAPAPVPETPETPFAREPEPVAPAPDPADTPPAPEIAAPAPTPLPTGPAIGKPATSLFNRAPDAAPDATPVPDADGTLVAERSGPLAALPEDSPLVRFSAPVTVPDGVPRMAVVLVDDGSGPLGPSGLKAFPFPVSFAISPAHPDAAAAAQGYRDLGFEVLVLGDMPDGAQAADVEVTMAGLIRAIPQAVAVLEDPDGSLQDSREVSSQVAAFLGDSGHGLITQPKGLNTAQKLALKDGVPAVTLFRDFDGEGQDASMIRRTLDQAAFRARQEGGVVMMGRLRADTISALVLWGLQDRSDTIALVPVSVVLAEALDG